MTTVLVVGATGYVGGRLVPRLVTTGYDVRCMVRNPGKVQCADVEVVAGDVFDEASVRAAMAGVDVLYYLVHSLADANFQELDRKAAMIVAKAARAAGVRRIVYLGGLRPADDDASRHLASRAEVGDVFISSGVPTAVLQASVIVGSGSTSYEMLRYLTERMPVIPVPPWAENKTQPIAICDVLDYLVGCATLPDEVNRAFDIGGPDILSYREMMQSYAKTSGLPARLMVPAPALPTQVMAQIVDRITPISAAIAQPLLESLVHELVCLESDIDAYLPGGGKTTFADAVRAAIARPTSSGDALPRPGDAAGSGGPMFVEERSFTSSTSVERLWEIVCRVGGENGWSPLPIVSEVRGLLDRVLGGRRDRPLRAGDLVDWWRVEEIDARNHRLILRAEMKTPGETWLELSVGAENGEAIYRQRLVFLPAGTLGHVYWLALRPVQEFLYDVMARNVVLVAQQRSTLLTPVSSLFSQLGRAVARTP
jgi:uncharacterized protein YbjT (DUF2867 family)